MSHKVICHIDMDCFFAACEVKRNPTLRGKPVIIGGDIRATRGVVCTASYEARKYGVHSAMPLSQAKKLCPEGVYIPSDISYYSFESRQIMAVLGSFSSLFEQASIDEAYIDITQLATRFFSLDRVASLIQDTILQSTGYTCSIGIACNKKVAKIASGMKKPAGITIVSDTRLFLEHLPIQNMPGIGKKTVSLYTQLDIQTIGDLAKHTVFFVKEHFGSSGVHFWNIAKGFDTTGISHKSVDKSYSRETTFQYDVKEAQTVYSTARRLSEKVFHKTNNCLFRTVGVKIRYSDFHTITRSSTFPTPISQLDLLSQTVQQLLSSSLEPTRPVRLVGVKVDNLLFLQSKQLTLDNWEVHA